MSMHTHYSIRKHLLIGILSALFATWSVTTVLTYLTTSHEINEIYDATMAQYAKVLSTLMAHEAEENRQITTNLQTIIQELGKDIVEQNPTISALANKYSVHDDDDHSSDEKRVEGDDYLFMPESPIDHQYERKIVFVIETADGTVLLRSDAIPSEISFSPGYNSIDVDGGWRTFGYQLDENNLRVLVAEQNEVRSEVVNEILINELWPVLAALPFISMIIWGVVNRGLKPLKSLAKNVASRSPQTLSPIETENIPKEVEPIIDALNQLFTRVKTALENERRFTANAAHELRTPLAALKTHAQVLQMHVAEENQSSISEILQSTDRASHLIEQLMLLAHAESAHNNDLEIAEIDLVSLIQGELARLSDKAFAKDIELSLTNEESTYLINTNQGLLSVLLRNLLDNAINYTPTEGEVSVDISGKKTFKVTIQDTGPGIPASKQHLMMKRFQRGDNQNVQGAGLGLSIVKQITELLNIDIVFSNRDDRTGLIVHLSIKPNF